MPPKTKPDPKKAAADTTIVPVEGAKFINIVCGSRESDLKLLVNINCRLDILLDYARTEFLKILTLRIAELKAQGITASNIPGMVSKPGSPKSSTARAQSATASARPQSPSTLAAQDPNVAILEEKLGKMLVLQSTLQGTSVQTLDVHEEGGQSANCKANLARTGSEVLRPSTVYFLGSYIEEDRYEPIKYYS